MVVIELASSDRSSAFHSKSFMSKLVGVIKPDGRCKKLGFIFVWKTVESVIKLDCDYKRCYNDGKRAAEKVIEKIFLTKFASDRHAFVKGMEMAVKQLQPAGLNPEDKREKVYRYCRLCNCNFYTAIISIVADEN